MRPSRGVLSACVVLSAVVAAPAAAGPRETVRRTAIVDVQDAGGPMAGTDAGTVVLLDPVPNALQPTAVRRREVGPDGVLSDATTALPEGFLWRFTSLDTDGTAALASETEVRFLGADGGLSDPFIASDRIDAIELTGGFLHLAEIRPAVGFRTTAAWEGRTAAGGRVGPSAALEPDAFTLLQYDGTPGRSLYADIVSLDGRPDGTAAVLVATHPAGRGDEGMHWIYEVGDGQVRPVPGPEPSIVSHLRYGERNSVVAAPGGVWHVLEDLGDVLPLGLRAEFEGSARLGYGGAAFPRPGWTTSGRASFHAATGGRLDVVAVCDPWARPERDRTARLRPIIHTTFRASPGAAPVATERLAGITSLRERFRRRGSVAAFANDGAAVVAFAETSSQTSAARLVVWTLGATGRVTGAVSLRARAMHGDLDAVACGTAGFAVRFTDESVVVPRGKRDVVVNPPSRTRLLFLRRVTR